MNDFILNVLLCLFNATTTILVAQYFFSLFVGKRAKNSLFSICAFVICFLSLQFVNNALANMLILVICTFMVSLNYCFSVLNKIVFTAILISLNVLVETVFVVSISSVFAVGALGATSGVFSIYGSLLSKLIVVIVCSIIGGFANKTLIGRFRFHWVSIYILPIAITLVTYVLHMSAFYYEDDHFLSMLSVISLILLIISNLLILRLINQLHETTLKETRLRTAEELVKQQERQYELLLRNNETIVKLRHDHKNFLIGILSIMSGNNKDDNTELRYVLEKELKLVEKASDKNVCGNSVIDSIMNYKISEARTKGINVVFEHNNVQKINLSGVDLSILLGNALDNAIEATEGLKDDNKTIEVSIKCVAEQIIITIINKVCKNVNVNRLQSRKGIMHGYGIMNMHSIASKYNGSVTFSCDDNVFTTIVILNIKQQLGLIA